MWLQYCKSSKVRSTKHSGVEYWRSKCTAIPNSREFEPNDIEYDKLRLQELIRYLDSKSSQNNTDDIMERGMNERVNTENIDVQEPLENVDDTLDAPTQEVDRDYIIDRSESEWETTENHFHGTVDRNEGDLQGPMEMVDEAVQDPLENKSVDDTLLDEQLDVDDPIIMM